MTGEFRYAFGLGLVFSSCNLGDAPFGPDLQHYIPYFKHYAHPYLYPGDLIFANANYRATFLAPLVGSIYRIVSWHLYAILFWGQMLVLLLWFSGLAAATFRAAS